MAVDRDTNDTKQSTAPEGDELSALGPEATETSASAGDEETMDAGALAALSFAGRRAADGVAKPGLASDGPPEEARLNLSAAGPAADFAPPSSPAAAELRNKPQTATPVAARSAAPVARRGWLPLLIGVALGAAVSALAFYRTPHAERASSEPSRAAAAVPQPASPSALPGVPAAGPARAPEQPVPAAATSVAAKPTEGSAANVPAHTPLTPSPPVAASPTARAPQHGPSAAPQRSATGPSTSAPPSPKPTPDPGPEPAASTVPKDSEEARLAAAAVPHSSQNPLDAVLDDAFANRHAHAAKLLADEATALPLAPSREDVTKAMTVLVPAIRGCAQGQSGLATAGIVVRNDGRVESVTLSGAPFAGTASGRCMEGVVRRARFPRFRQAAFRVQFPFAMQ